MRRRKGGGSNSLSVSGLEAKRKISRLIPVAESEAKLFSIKLVISALNSLLSSKSQYCLVMVLWLLPMNSLLLSKTQDCFVMVL